MVQRGKSKKAKPATKPPKAGAARPKTKTMPLVRFNAQAFLDTVGVGRFIGKYKSGETVFLQGDPADAVFYIQKGKVQITVLSKQGKEGVIAVLERFPINLVHSRSVGRSFGIQLA